MLLLPALRPSINRTGFDGAIINVRKRKLKKKTDRTRRERMTKSERRKKRNRDRKKKRESKCAGKNNNYKHCYVAIY